jgi:hypothetical protein
MGNIGHYTSWVYLHNIMQPKKTIATYVQIFHEVMYAMQYGKAAAHRGKVGN